MWDLGEVQVRGDFHLRPTESDTPGPACVQAGGESDARWSLRATTSDCQLREGRPQWCFVDRSRNEKRAGTMFCISFWVQP